MRRPAMNELATCDSDTAPGRPAARMTLLINGVQREIEADSLTTLLDLLRDQLGLTGTKDGCGSGFCGACTVLRDGRRINSCLALALACAGSEVTTIELVSGSAGLHPLQQAFLDHDALQCGYCTPGQVMSALGYIAELRDGCASPGDVREQMSGNLCRCGAYTRIADAIAAFAATQL
jgi:xanthine dehydrogenase YagT iron-sulfur-binding subunit